MSDSILAENTELPEYKDLSWLLFLIVTTVLICAIVVLAMNLKTAKEIIVLKDEILEEQAVSGVWMANEVAGLLSEKALLEQEVKHLTERADAIAVLDPLDMLLSPAELGDFLDLIPEGNPFKGDWYVTARYGADRGHSGNPRMGHRGNDIVVIGSNWAINPIGSGTVVDIGIDTWLGKYVVVEHNERVRSVYAHLTTIFFEALPGETVTPETRIGIMGSTGFSDGAHLHIEVQVFDGKAWHPIDSYPFIEHPQSN